MSGLQLCSMIALLVLGAIVALFAILLRRASEKPKLFFAPTTPGGATAASTAQRQSSFATNHAPEETARMQRLLKEVSFQRITRARFYPTPWLLNGHLQTVFSAKVRTLLRCASSASACLLVQGWKDAPHIEYHRQILEVEAQSDAYQHGTVALDWCAHFPAFSRANWLLARVQGCRSKRA